MEEEKLSSGAEKVERITGASHEAQAEAAARRAMEHAETAARLEAAAETRREAAARASLAEDEQKQERMQRRAQEKAARREEKRRRREQGKKEGGIGGWLAAVIVLGVACLALTTVVTAGIFRMNGYARDAENAFRANLYEMVSVSEDLNGNLQKLRVSAGREEQRRLLTEVLVDSALLESALERCPVDGVTAADLSLFINRTNAFARALLAHLSAGGTLTEEEQNTVAYLYAVNSRMSGELNDLAAHVTPAQIAEFLSGKGGDVKGRFDLLGEETHVRPDYAVEPPFSEEGNVEENQLFRLEEVDAATAEEMLKEYFSGEHVRSVTRAGETVTREIACYNFLIEREDGSEIFAQITKRGGRLAFFEAYGACTEKNFDLTTCDLIAREYLSGLGMEGMSAVWLADTGAAAQIAYVPMQNGVRIYSDMVLVRVCESRGKVTGLDCSKYLMNHTDGRACAPQLTRAEAEAKLSPALTVRAAFLSLVPVDGRERLCYEFDCLYGEEQFLIYVDAETGEEVQVFCVCNGAGGKYLR